MHGYEMIQEIGRRSEGAWTPSAGSIYPTLQLLEDEGQVRGEEVEGKRRFSLTEEGVAEQTERAGEETPWDAVRADAGPERMQLAASMKKLHHAIRQALVAADGAEQRQVRELLDEARRRIYAVLAEER
jgi:DNA-binding PadR family transcriptional regulator